MLVYMIRLFFALIGLEIGLFWASLILLSTFWRLITGGRKEFRKLITRREHKMRPEIAMVGYDHDYVRTRSGIRFHYVHSGDLDKPLMLCLHGFPECWYSWKHVLKSFNSSYHVVAIDMRGYGDSDKPKSIGQYHIHYLVSDVREIIRALGYENAVLVGHDWGAVVTWETARYFPEVVSRVIAMNCPPAKVFQSFIISHFGQFLKSWYMFLYQVPFFPEWMVGVDDYKAVTGFFQGKGIMGIKNKKNCLTDDEIEVYKNAVGRNITYGINYYRAGGPLYTGLNLKPKSKEVTQPALLIWGTEDAALDVRLVDATKKRVPQVETVLVEGASHWVQLDEPEKVIAAMKQFLKSR